MKNDVKFKTNLLNTEHFLMELLSKPCTTKLALMEVASFCGGTKQKIERTAGQLVIRTTTQLLLLKKSVKISQICVIGVPK